MRRQHKSYQSPNRISWLLIAILSVSAWSYSAYFGDNSSPDSQTVKTEQLISDHSSTDSVISYERILPELSAQEASPNMPSAWIFKISVFHNTLAKITLNTQAKRLLSFELIVPSRPGKTIPDSLDDSPSEYFLG